MSAPNVDAVNALAVLFTFGPVALTISRVGQTFLHAGRDD